jgi:hypothetical protein
MVSEDVDMAAVGLVKVRDENAVNRAFPWLVQEYKIADIRRSFDVFNP